MVITTEDFIKIRKIHGLNQNEMGRIIGVQQSAVAKIENNYYDISKEVQERLIKHFDITPGKLSLIRGIYSEFMEKDWSAV